jgi:hypothetical protein
MSNLQTDVLCEVQNYLKILTHGVTMLKPTTKELTIDVKVNEQCNECQILKVNKVCKEKFT